MTYTPQQEAQLLNDVALLLRAVTEIDSEEDARAAIEYGRYMVGTNRYTDFSNRFRAVSDRLDAQDAKLNEVLAALARLTPPTA